MYILNIYVNIPVLHSIFISLFLDGIRSTPPTSDSNQREDFILILIVSPTFIDLLQYCTIIIIMHNSSTKSQSQTSYDGQYNQQCLSTEFRSFNKIYELQSIIIKLLIEKDKNQITYANSINEISSISSQLQKQINDQKRKIKEKDRSIDGLNMLIQEQRSRITRVQAERDELQKILDSVPDQKNNPLSVNLLLAGYSKVKVDKQNKQTLINTLTQQNQVLSTKILEMKAENKSLKESYEDKIKILKQKMQNEMEMYKQQMRKQKQEYSQSIGKCMKCIGEQRQQIRQIKSEKNMIQKKMQSYKLTIHRMHQLELQNEIMKADQNNQKKKGLGNEQQKMIAKFEQIRQSYNTLVEQNKRVSEDNVIKLGQIVHSRSLINQYTSEIEFLKLQLNNTKQIQYKMQSYLAKLQSQDLNKPSQDQPKNHFSKLQQLLLEYSTEKKNFQSKLSQSSKINFHLESKLEQMQKQQKSLQQRIITLQQTIQTLEKTNKNLTNKISKSQNQNSSLKLEIEKLALQAHELEIKLHQSSPAKSNARIVQISSQKYHNLKQGLLVLGAEKTRLIKQNICLRAEMQQIQQSMVKRIKQFNTLSFELHESKKRQQKWKEEKQELYERIKRLQNKIDRNLREHDQQKKQLQAKINIMKECVDRIKKQTSSGQKINHRTLNISFITKIYQIIIQPSRKFNEEQRIKLKPQLQKQLEQQTKIKNEKISALSLKNEIRQLKKNIFTNLKEEKIEKNQQFNLRIRERVDGSQTINRKERIHTDRILLQKQKPRMRSKEFGKEMDYKKLDEMINQLRQQNRQLSKQRVQ